MGFQETLAPPMGAGLLCPAQGRRLSGYAEEETAADALRPPTASSAEEPPTRARGLEAIDDAAECLGVPPRRPPRWIPFLVERASHFAKAGPACPELSGASHAAL